MSEIAAIETGTGSKTQARCSHVDEAGRCRRRTRYVYRAPTGLEVPVWRTPPTRYHRPGRRPTRPATLRLHLADTQPCDGYRTDGGLCHFSHPLRIRLAHQDQDPLRQPPPEKMEKTMTPRAADPPAPTGVYVRYHDGTIVEPVRVRYSGYYPLDDSGPTHVWIADLPPPGPRRPGRGRRGRDAARAYLRHLRLTMHDLAPLHSSCRRRHSPGLPCWVGRRIKAHLVLVLEEYGDCCCHCGLVGCDSVEHVQPRSRWGTDELANLRPTHMRCNSRRGTRPMPGWGVGVAPHTRPRWRGF